MSALAGREGSAGHPVNHVCLAMSADDMGALRRRLEGAGSKAKSELGWRPEADRASFIRRGVADANLFGVG